MKRIVSIAILFFSVSVLAQNGSPAPAPSAVQQKEFQESLQNLVEAQRSVELANAKLQQTIFKVMATMKISPDEWEPQLDKGTLTFKKKPEPKKPE